MVRPSAAKVTIATEANKRLRSFDLANMTLDEKIAYLRANSKPFDSRRFEHSYMTIFAMACERAGFEVREDDFYGGPEAANGTGRLGLSAYSEKNNPLIYLLPSMNKTNLELVDTILHEALHATAKPLGRHRQPPEDIRSTKYLLEELCVHAGLKHLYSTLKRPEMRQLSRRNKEHHEILMRGLRKSVSDGDLELWNKYGESAAEHLLEHIFAIEEELKK